MLSQPPRQSLVHLALVLANSFFGLGAIVGSVGLFGMNPLHFSLVRVLMAGILLLLVTLLVKFSRPHNHPPPPEMSETESLLVATTIENYNYNRILKSGRGYYKEEYDQNYYQWMPQNKHDWRSFLVLGFLVAMGLGAYLCGLQMAGPIAGSIWQPSMPVWTVAISMLIWKLEKVQTWRVIGVFVAFGGYAGMVLMNGQKKKQPEEEEHLQVHNHSGVMFLLGNFLFFVSSICGSCFVLLSKKLLNVYSPLTVTAWSYLISFPFLLAMTIGSSLVPSWKAIVCPDCEAWDGSVLSLLFSIPKDALPALLYYVLVLSMGAWGLLLWANRYVTGTFVVGYSVIQPIISSVFVVLLVMMNWFPDCQQDMQQVPNEGGSCLDKPGVGALAGMVGILVGLALIVHTEPKRDEPRNPEWEGLKVLSIETNFSETHNAVYGSIVSNGSTSLLRP